MIMVQLRCSLSIAFAVAASTHALAQPARSITVPETVSPQLQRIARIFDKHLGK